MSEPERVCVVHLVREANGLAAFRGFLESYLARTAGIEHELLLVLKGFSSARAEKPYLEMARGIASTHITVDDSGFDLTAYATAFRTHDVPYYCFLNSYSRIEVDSWLKALRDALRTPEAGIVGATGSWASQRSCMLYQLGFPSAYQRAYRSRRQTRAEFRALTDPGARDGGGRSSNMLLRKARTARGFFEQAVAYDPFPAYHLRTNAFMAARDVLTGLDWPDITQKIEAYRFESGKSSMTNQVEGAGLRALVVGRDGVAYAKRAWYASNTFWQSDQENLLIADNQTEQYRRGKSALRLLLSRFAWGEKARPQLTVEQSAKGAALDE